MAAISRAAAAQLRKTALFAGLDEDLLARIEAIALTTFYDPHSVIFEKGSPGDAMYMILRGEVAVYTVSPEGRMLLHNRLLAGSTLGEIALIDGGERTAGAMAMTRVDCVRFDRASFVPLVRREPELSWRLLSATAALLRHVSEGREDAVFLDTRRRLAKLLTRLVESHGRPTPAGVRVTRAMKQEEMATELGVSREIVNRSLRSLASAGLVVQDSGALIVPDPEALRMLATEAPAR